MFRSTTLLWRGARLPSRNAMLFGASMKAILSARSASSECRVPLRRSRRFVPGALPSAHHARQDALFRASTNAHGTAVLVRREFVPLSKHRNGLLRENATGGAAESSKTGGLVRRIRVPKRPMRNHTFERQNHAVAVFQNETEQKRMQKKCRGRRVLRVPRRRNVLRDLLLIAV